MKCEVKKKNIVEKLVQVRTKVKSKRVELINGKY